MAATIALIAAAAVSAAATIAQGAAAAKAAKRDATTRRALADRQARRAAIQAAEIRRKGSREAAVARALLADRGFAADTGTPGLLAQDRAAEMEFQALTRENIGATQAFIGQQEANRLIREGRNRRTAGFVKAGTTLLTAGSKLAGIGGFPSVSGGHGGLPIRTDAAGRIIGGI